MGSYDTSPIYDAEKRMLDGRPSLKGYAENAADIEEERKRVAARAAGPMPTATAASVGGVSSYGAGASNQAALADRLKAVASGSTPTAGAQQIQAGNDAAKRAMMASAFGRPGGVRAMRTTANQGALMNAQSAQQANILGAQEQQAAMNQYAQVGTAMRAGDLGDAAEANRIGLANAGFAQSAAMANQDAAMRWQAMNDQQKRATLGMSIDLGQADWDHRVGSLNNFRQKEMGEAAQAQGAQAAEDQKAAQVIKTFASVMAMSDERAKTDIRPADDKLRAFLSALEPAEYRYRDPSAPGAAPGRHVSPMAQDIESTELGRAAVQDGPDGKKRVDYGRLLGTMLAAEAHLNKRINKLEGGR